jgi:hypothetical protein
MRYIKYGTGANTQKWRSIRFDDWQSNSSMNQMLQGNNERARSHIQPEGVLREHALPAVRPPNRGAKPLSEEEWMT